MTPIKLLSYTAFALCAFAGNSLLSRLALAHASIDPISFAFIRHLGAAASLFSLSLILRKKSGLIKKDFQPGKASWLSAFWLLAYALPFALAYQELAAGTGALILFGFVQLTMISSALFYGERPSMLRWSGLMVALSGVLLLFLPGASAPSLYGAVLMSISGVAWGVYSLRGKSGKAPLIDTRGHFLRGLILLFFCATLLKAFGIYGMTLSRQGIVVALCSGAFTSGIGYALWYAVLPHLKSTTASTLQLLVPALTVLGGIAFLEETPSLRVFSSLLLILGGVLAWLLLGRQVSGAR